MEKKYLFFDIDGTLTDRATGEIVPSATGRAHSRQKTLHWLWLVSCHG